MGPGSADPCKRAAMRRSARQPTVPFGQLRVALTEPHGGRRLEAMPRRSILALVAMTSLLATAGFGGEASDLRPGNRVGRMTLVRGTVATADQKLFDICDPVILKGGRYHRRCGVVPRVERLFIGYGLFAAPREIKEAWADAKWAGWFDGRRIALRAFGTSDRMLHGFPPAGGKDVILREWRVMLLSASSGRHTLRYRSDDPAGSIDATWTFVVAQ